MNEVGRAPLRVELGNLLPFELCGEPGPQSAEGPARSGRRIALVFLALLVVGLTVLGLICGLGSGGGLGLGVWLWLWPGGLFVVDGVWGLVPFQVLWAAFPYSDAPVNALGHPLFGIAIQPLDNLLSLGQGFGAALFLQGHLGQLIQPEKLSALGVLHHEVGKLFQTFPGRICALAPSCTSN